MGFDVIGNDPTSEDGRYFRNNVWWWRRLVDFCFIIAPKICASCEYWQSNDGDGLDADDAILLGIALEEAVNDGTAQHYKDILYQSYDKMPDLVCDYCEGTGIRYWPSQVEEDGCVKKCSLFSDDDWQLKQPQECNGCHGTGVERPWATNYPFSPENVAEFAEFCKASGGFKIC
jgi:hypothetical protein